MARVTCYARVPFPERQGQEGHAGLRRLPLLLLLWLLWLPVLEARAAVDITTPLINFEVRPHLELRFDPGGVLTLAEILDTRSEFAPADRVHFPRCDCAIESPRVS